jgi:hypothetical protein
VADLDHCAIVTYKLHAGKNIMAQTKVRSALRHTV